VSREKRIERVIVTDLVQLRDQVVLTPNMEAGINFLLNLGPDDLPVGRALIDGDNVYAEVQSYETVAGEATEFEAHSKYIDIQFVRRGEEIIAWASDRNITETTAYVDADDYRLGTAEADKVTQIRLTTGQLAVFYPIDFHAPRRAAGTPSAVSKIVVKVAVGG
jgi:biofilm protein TabA